MLLDSLGQGVLSIFEHFHHQVQLLVKFSEGVLLLGHQLLLNLNDVILEDFGLGERGLHLFGEDLLFLGDGVHFVLGLYLLIADAVALVVANYAF